VSGAALAGTARPGLSRPAVGVDRGRLALAWRAAAAGLAIFVLAAGIRLVAIDTYVTIDESRWVQRAADFAAYIDQGNLERTFIIGHPGVTTMWTALLGMGPERARHFSFLEGREDATRRAGYFEALIAARRPFAIVGALGVAAVALLGWRLLGMGAGMLGGLLLAFEPFLIAHARVAHIDSGLTVYMTVAALSGLVYFAAGGARPYLLLSGVATGLAFLTKAPSVYLVGFVPLAAGICWLLSGRHRASLPRLALELLAWGLIAATIATLLWPALRVNPVGTMLQLVEFTERVGGGEHDNFFLGSATDDPGTIFYPFALALRLTPVTLVGLILLVGTWRYVGGAQRRIVLLLALYCAGFMTMMTIGPKKFDRYLLPIFPVLGLLAGLGLCTAAVAVGRRLGGWRYGVAATVSLVAVAVVVQAATLLPVLRYPLAYYNPLLGGGALAERLILVGWGEGLDQVGAWIDAQPRPLSEPTVATSYHRVLQAQLTGSAIPLEHVRMADYVVPYVNTLQRGDEAAVLAPYLTSASPEYLVRINGIEYARVYKGPRHPVTVDHGLSFDRMATLLRSTVAPGSGDVRPGEEVSVGLRWDLGGADQAWVAVAILATDGRAIVRDERPIGADGPDERGQPGDIHRLTVPPRTPPGSYRLAIRVQDARGRGLPPVSATGLPFADEWVTLRDLTVSEAS
jgi:Dolichyl-phosphate-mannose-protein mannosyltransferase